MNNLQMSAEEDLYYEEGKTGATASTSLLSSNSKWLNSLVLRELIAQDNLRRNGDDVGALQLVPEIMNEFHRLLDGREVETLLQHERQRRPDFAAVAQLLHISPATLRRRLDLECMSYALLRAHFTNGWAIRRRRIASCIANGIRMALISPAVPVIPIDDFPLQCTKQQYEFSCGGIFK